MGGVQISQSQVAICTWRILYGRSQAAFDWRWGKVYSDWRLICEVGKRDAGRFERMLRRDLAPLADSALRPCGNTLYDKQFYWSTPLGSLATDRVLRLSLIVARDLEASDFNRLLHRTHGRKFNNTFPVLIKINITFFAGHHDCCHVMDWFGYYLLNYEEDNKKKNPLW